MREIEVEHTAFVTSANLTGLGLDENIELGLLVGDATRTLLAAGRLPLCL